MTFFRVFTAVFTSAMLFSSMPGHAAALNGTWSGSGFVQPAEGKRENVRCRVTYDQQSDRVFGVSATCASSGNSIRQTGEVLKIRPGRYAGDFYSRQYDIGGRITVSVSGSNQVVTFSGSGVTGRLTLSKR